VRSGSALLAGVVVGVWTLVYLVTQQFVDPPLGVLPTLATGTALTVAAVLGYPSALRGPRASSRPAPRDPRVQPIAAAGRSMPLRSGLTPDAARRTVELLKPVVGGDAVAIADREQVLAFVGPGADHHRVGWAPQTRVTAEVIEKQRTVTVTRPEHLGCTEPDCPLVSAVVAPLAIGSRVVGILGVYRVHPDPPPRGLVEDMASILSLHLELAEMDRERRLSAHARLDALRAQINPHFLFNILNTIASKARTDPEDARQLLLRLSDFFRYAVRQDGHFAEFAQEYFFVRTYLSLEQARYGDRLRVRYDIDPQVLTTRVPVLTIQPLVENAVKHGIADKVEGGTIHLKARVDPLTRTTSIRVWDDGVGMEPDVLARLTHGEPAPDDGDRSPRSGGVGLRNISERLDSLFGERYDLSISSTAGRGTVVDLRVPLR